MIPLQRRTISPSERQRTDETDTADDTADPAVVGRLVAIADTATDDGAWLAALLTDPLTRTATAADLLTAAALLHRET